MDVAESVRSFIVDELGWGGDPAVLTGDYPLMGRRVIDSLGILQLVTFLEREYRIRIGDEEVVPDNLGSLDAIARLVEDKTVVRGVTRQTRRER
ncbi:MAG: acyl carrier protein [Actinomycetota bacterium]